MGWGFSLVRMKNFWLGNTPSIFSSFLDISRLYKSKPKFLHSCLLLKIVPRLLYLFLMLLVLLPWDLVAVQACRQLIKLEGHVSFPWPVKISCSKANQSKSLPGSPALTSSTSVHPFTGKPHWTSAPRQASQACSLIFSVLLPIQMSPRERHSLLIYRWTVTSVKKGGTDAAQ